MIIRIEAPEEKYAAHHVQVDEQENEVESAIGLRLPILLQTRLNDEALSAEVSWKLEQTEHVEDDKRRRINIFND